MRSGPGIPRNVADGADSVSVSTSGGGSGYYRGAPPRAGGTGSMAGPNGAGSRSLFNSDGWTPTVSNLVFLVLLELGAYCAFRYAFRTAHGG
jgi:hypothetical protein